MTEFVYADGSPVDRTKTIGASEIGAIMCPSDYSSPHSLWMQKMGLVQVETSYAMRMGKFLEPFILEEGLAHAAELGFEFQNVKPNSTTYAHPVYPHFTATPDADGEYLAPIDFGDRYGDTKPDPCVFETKYANDYIAENFGQEGSDQCPLQYVCQTVWQMLVKRVKWGFLFVSLSNRGTACYQFYAGPNDAGKETRRLMSLCMTKADQWFKNYLIPGVEPPLEGTEVDTRFVKEKYSYDDGSMVAADEEMTQMVMEYAKAKKLAAEASLEAQKCQNTLRAYMGEASALETTHGLVTCKADKNGQRSFRIPRGLTNGRELV